MNRKILPSEKKARGTWKPSRDEHWQEYPEPDALPQRPDWLTPEGLSVWLDDIGRVAATRLVAEHDATMFANYCNLQGALIQAWRSGAVPPAAHLIEARRLAEVFGLAGARSRLTQVGPPQIEANVFSKWSRKPKGSGQE